MGSKSPKTEDKKKTDLKAASCVFTETIKQSSSLDKKAVNKTKSGKTSKKEEVVPKKRGRNASVTTGKKKEDQEDKVWICPSCKLPDDGSPMIGCDNCEEWYHWVCVGIQVDPEEDSWFCPRCTESQRNILHDDSDEDSEDSKSSVVKKKKRKKNPG